MELVPIDRSLPETVETILQDVRAAERIRHEVEAERDREQLRLVEIERKIRDEQLEQLQHERRARDRILREAIHPQIEQAQQVVAQVQASLLRVAREITTTISRGGEVSAATRRSWSQRLNALTSLAPGNVPLERALEDLSQLSRKGEVASTRHIEITSRSVQRALAELERRASLELNADQIWQLMREGRGACRSSVIAVRRSSRSRTGYIGWSSHKRSKYVCSKWEGRTCWRQARLMISRSKPTENPLHPQSNLRLS